MKQIDVRFDAQTMDLMQSLLGSTLIKYKSDPFIFSPSVFGIVGIVTDRVSVAFTNSIKVMDYYGALEDVAVFQAEPRDEEDFNSMMVGAVMVDTCINGRIMAVDIVNEHQKLFKNEMQTYDVWTIRGVIFRLEDGLELSLEKNVWFSEMITIKKGYNLIDDFAPITEFEEDWDEGYRGECTREIITLH